MNGPLALVERVGRYLWQCTLDYEVMPYGDMKLSFLHLLFICLLTANSARAQLSADPLERAYVASAVDTQVTVEYTLSNPGPSTIRILSVDSGCDCMQITLAKHTLQP